jgi:hypothetical protein
MAQLLLEDTLGEFRVDRSKGQRGIIAENVNGASLYRVPGRFSVCNVTNGNNRRYPRKVWENNLVNPQSKLRKLIEKNAAFGLLEHPEDGRVTLLSPICAITTKADLIEDNNEAVVEGELTLVNTAEGQKLKALIEAGYNPFVSSRGYGSLTRSNDGVDEVQEDFVCEGWDVVAMPSFEQAELRPARQTPQRESKPSPATPLSPSVSLAEGAEQSPKATGPTAQPTKSSTTAMEQKEIRAQLDALKGQTNGKLDNRMITEAYSRCETLHRDVATWGSEDAKRSWDAIKLHEEIKGVEDRLIAVQQAPSKELTKIRENQTKLLQVTQIAAQKAVDFKKKLGESLVRGGKLKDLSGKLLERGRAWKDKALAIQEDHDNLDFQLDIVSEALDMLVETYNADVVKLSRKLMVQKFGDKITEEIKTRLDKATHPQEVYGIYEELEKVAKAAAPVTEDKKDDKKVPVTEAKADKPGDKSPASSTPPAKVNEAKEKKPEGVTIINAVKDPRSLSESITIAKRLSAALVTA